MRRAAIRPSSLWVGRIRPFQCDQPHECIGIGCLPDDLDAGVGEQSDETRPDQHHVVGDYDPHGITAVTTAAPVALSAVVNRPPSAPTRSATSTKSAATT